MRSEPATRRRQTRDIDLGGSVEALHAATNSNDSFLAGRIQVLYVCDKPRPPPRTQPAQRLRVIPTGSDIRCPSSTARVAATAVHNRCGDRR
jgi:hypothetical protein